MKAALRIPLVALFTQALHHRRIITESSSRTAAEGAFIGCIVVHVMGKNGIYIYIFYMFKYAADSLKCRPPDHHNAE